MTSDAGTGSEGSSRVVAQYEALRRAALGQALPPEARCGLLVFLRRGMWGWVRAMAMADANVSPPQSCSASLNGVPADESRALIHVFAAMAMNTGNEGAPA